MKSYVLIGKTLYVRENLTGKQLKHLYKPINLINNNLKTTKA